VLFEWQIIVFLKYAPNIKINNSIIFNYEFIKYNNTMGFAASSSNKPSKQERCSLCGRVFNNAEDLNAHKQLDHGEQSHEPAGVS